MRSQRNIGGRPAAASSGGGDETCLVMTITAPQFNLSRAMKLRMTQKNSQKTVTKVAQLGKDIKGWDPDCTTVYDKISEKEVKALYDELSQHVETLNKRLEKAEKGREKAEQLEQQIEDLKRGIDDAVRNAEEGEEDERDAKEILDEVVLALSDLQVLGEQTLVMGKTKSMNAAARGDKAVPKAESVPEPAKKPGFVSFGCDDGQSSQNMKREPMSPKEGPKRGQSAKNLSVASPQGAGSRRPSSAATDRRPSYNTEVPADKPQGDSASSTCPAQNSKSPGGGGGQVDPAQRQRRKSFASGEAPGSPAAPPMRERKKSIAGVGIAGLEANENAKGQGGGFRTEMLQKRIEELEASLQEERKKAEELQEKLDAALVKPPSPPPRICQPPDPPQQVGVPVLPTISAVPPQEADDDECVDLPGMPSNRGSVLAPGCNSNNRGSVLAPASNRNSLLPVGHSASNQGQRQSFMARLMGKTPSNQGEGTDEACSKRLSVQKRSSAQPTSFTGRLSQLGNFISSKLQGLGGMGTSSQRNSQNDGIENIEETASAGSLSERSASDDELRKSQPKVSNGAAR